MYANGAFVTLLLIFCCTFFYGLDAGSHCPPRKDIYPCICMNKAIGKKKVETTVICHGLKSPNDFVAIESVLLPLEIDKFLLYDSFWEKEPSVRNGRSEQSSTVKFMDSYVMKEVEIVDTILPLLPCSEAPECSRLAITRLTAINSSSLSRSFSSSCPSWSSRFISWITCFNSLKYLTVSHGNINSLKIGQTFGVLKELREFNLPYNQIQSIEDRAFGMTTFPNLRILDFSHNELRSIKSVFSSEMKIEYLDVSYNPLRSVPNLQNLSKLKTLKLSNTRISYLFPVEWAHIPKPLRNIDLSDNLMNCDCAMKWVNSTFHINTNFIGACSKPLQVTGMKIRRASRYLIERCNEKEEIVPKSQVEKKSNE